MKPRIRHIVLPVSKIKPRPDRRRARNKSSDNLLALSILHLGVLSPLQVVEENEAGYAVIDGNARLAVCQRLGIQVVPCLVYPKGSDRALLVKNVSRMDKPWDHRAVSKFQAKRIKP
jgi:ParB-like chromosome segregation protein Spo0J